MADRGRFLRDGRELLVATGMLALALGLGSAGAGVIDVATTPDPTRSAGAHAPPGVAPDVGGWRLAAQEVRPSIGSREDTAVLAFRGEDGREYLARMAAMMRLRGPATYVGPYQASLNPAVYLAGETAPSATFTSN